MTFNDRAADIQSDAHSRDFGCEEWSKDLVGFDRHAAAVIGNFKDRLRLVGVHVEFRTVEKEAAGSAVSLLPEIPERKAADAFHEGLRVIFIRQL